MTDELFRDDAASLAIVDTRKGSAPGSILHLAAPGTDLAGRVLALLVLAAFAALALWVARQGGHSIDDRP